MYYKQRQFLCAQEAYDYENSQFEGPKQHSERKEIMYKILVAKFHSCPTYQRALKKQEHFTAHTRHKFWGTGHHGEGENALGQVHQRVRDNWQNILIAGSSHTRRMDAYLMAECRHDNIPATIDLLCLPGGRIKSLTCVLRDVQLMQYDKIFLIISSNDVFVANRQKRNTCTGIVEQLKRLVRSIECRTRAEIFLNPLLPRRVPKVHTLAQKERITFYNQNALRINRKMLTNLNQPAFWANNEANEPFVQPDGTHLNSKGKHVLAHTFLQVLFWMFHIYTAMWQREHQDCFVAQGFNWFPLYRSH